MSEQPASSGARAERGAPDTTTEPVSDGESANERAEPSSKSEPSDEAPRQPYDERGLERPRFLLDFPHDPQLELLIRAFEAGNYAYVRQNAERVATEATSEAVRDAARELRRRIDPDPLAKYLLLISILLLVFLVLWAYLAQDPPSPA